MARRFTDRFCTTGERQPTATRVFDRVCTDNRIEHRLTKPRTPQTNGMIERFNGHIADILSYIRYQSRGQLTKIEIPKDDLKALETYEKGKQFYFVRRGQLNFSCAHCHALNPGNRLRSDILSPAFGHTTHFPVYRSK